MVRWARRCLWTHFVTNSNRKFLRPPPPRILVRRHPTGLAHSTSLDPRTGHSYHTLWSPLITWNRTLSPLLSMNGTSDLAAHPVTVSVESVGVRGEHGEVHRRLGKAA